MQVMFGHPIQLQSSARAARAPAPVASGGRPGGRRRHRQATRRRSTLIQGGGGKRPGRRTRRDINHRWPTTHVRNKMSHVREQNAKPGTTPRKSPNPQPGPSVLLAEDDSEMRRLLATALQQSGYRVIECQDGVSLTWRLREIEQRNTGNAFDLIISDIWMPGITALEVLEGMRRRKTLPPVILITAFGDALTHSRARRVGAVAMFDKPFALEELLDRVRELAPPR
jgi:CheY-like chemotaxis protein